MQSLEGRRVEELRQKVAAEAGIFLINFDVHVLPALYTNLYIPSTLKPDFILWHKQLTLASVKYYVKLVIYFFRQISLKVLEW